MDARSEGKRKELLRRKRRVRSTRRPVEIAVVGEVDDWEEDVIETLMRLDEGRECVFYIDSTGGSVYGALAVVTLLRRRKLKATGVVLGECSSASLLLLAACDKRLVTRHSTMLFHKMRWQSERRVDSAEAVHWARHFETLEREIDDLQVRLFGAAEKEVRRWTETGQFVTGPEMVALGLAELIEL